MRFAGPGGMTRLRTPYRRCLTPWIPADIVPFCERHGMSKEEMMELMGSSP